MKKLKERFDEWGYKTDPEGLTNYDGLTLGILISTFLGFWFILALWGLSSEC